MFRLCFALAAFSVVVSRRVYVDVDVDDMEREHSWLCLRPSTLQ